MQSHRANGKPGKHTSSSYHIYGPDRPHLYKAPRMDKCSKICEKNEQRVRTAVHRRGKKMFNFTQNKGNTNWNYDQYLQFTRQTGKSPECLSPPLGRLQRWRECPSVQLRWRAKPQITDPNTLWASNSHTEILDTGVKWYRYRFNWKSKNRHLHFCDKDWLHDWCNNRAMKFYAAIRKGIKGSSRWRAWSPCYTIDKARHKKRL